MAKEKQVPSSSPSTRAAEAPKAAGSVFEVANIKALIELMQEHELSEIDLKQSDQRVRLRRGSLPAAVASQVAAPLVAPTTAPVPAAAVAEPDDGEFINSPTIGTFYSRPKPDAPDFVKVGDTVSADTIVCLVEAMKMFNEIPAGISGKIVEVLVKNEEPVDNNKPLFKVIPS